MRFDRLDGPSELVLDRILAHREQRGDGLVESRREGTTVHYRIARPEVLTVVEALHEAFCGSRPGAP